MNQRLAELEQQLKQHEIVVGENKFKMNKLEQEIELLTEQIEDNDRQASHSRKLLDEKVFGTVPSIISDLFFFREQQKLSCSHSVRLLQKKSAKCQKILTC